MFKKMKKLNYYKKKNTPQYCRRLSQTSKIHKCRSLNFIVDPYVLGGNETLV